MNLSSYKTKKYPLVAALQGPAGCEFVESF